MGKGKENDKFQCIDPNYRVLKHEGHRFEEEISSG